MSNPFDGTGATPEHDAFYAGVAERYQRLVDEDKLLIDRLPLDYTRKTQLLNEMIHARTMQRYLELRQEKPFAFDMGDGVLVGLGADALLAMAQMIGYTGSTDKVAVLVWFADLCNQVRRAFAMNQ